MPPYEARSVDATASTTPSSPGVCPDGKQPCTAEETPGLETRDVVVTMVLAAFVGVAFGLTVGFPAFYFVFDGMSRTCTGFTGRDACEAAATHGGCVWTAELGAEPPPSNASALPATASCKYGDFRTVYCPQHATQAACAAEPACTYDYGAGACEHAAGMAAWEAGLFAMGQPLGAAIASFAANYAMDRATFRPLLLASSLLLVAGAAFLHAGRAADVFGVVVVGRLVSGAATAAMRQICSVLPYVVLGASAPQAGTATTVLQPFTELGILVVAGYTYAAAPRELGPGDPSLEALVHGHVALLHALAAAVAVTCVFLREPALAEGQRGSVPIPAAGLIAPLARYPGNVAVLALTPASFILTGLFGFSVFAPLYSDEAFGIEPSFAPLVIQIFSAFFGLLSFALRRVFVAPRPVFLFGALVSSCGSLAFGVVVQPDVGASAEARQIGGLFVVAVFFFALQAFVGSALYEVGLPLVPGPLAAGAAAILNAFFNVFAAILSLVFPLAIVALSGGPSGNILLGVSSLYFIMGGLGLLFFGIHVWKLHPTPAGSDQEHASKPTAPESA